MYGWGGDSTPPALTRVKSQTFHGFATVDLSLPPSHPFIHFEDFPPFFVNTMVEYSDWGEYTQKNYSEIVPKNYRKLLIQGMSAQKVTVSTNLLKFYLDLNIEIS